MKSDGNLLLKLDGFSYWAPIWTALHTPVDMFEESAPFILSVESADSVLSSSFYNPIYYLREALDNSR